MGSFISKPHSNPSHYTSPKQSAFDGLSDEEAIAFLETYNFAGGRFISESGIERPVWRVSNDTVVKCLGSRTTGSLQDFEAYTMALVAAHTSIPVPRIRKQVFWKEYLYVFMEHIDGDDLIDRWPHLSWWRRFRIACALRRYVAQLRTVPVAPVPGPIDGSGEPLICRGHWFTEAGDGPFPSYPQLTSWFSRKLRISVGLAKEIHRVRQLAYTVPDAAPFDDTAPLVLTHGDISFWNVRLGRDGTPWLLDWGFAGVYPQWFEYTAIMAYDDFLARTPRSWFWFAPLIAGWYRSQHYFMRSISLGLVYYGVSEPSSEHPDLD